MAELFWIRSGAFLFICLFCFNKEKGSVIRMSEDIKLKSPYVMSCL